MFNFIKKKDNIKKITDENRLKGSLFGFFVGDAIGVPVEFISREELKKRKITDMQEYGTHNQPKGTWSDDSSMVIATLDSLNKNNGINYDDIMNNFIAWYKKGKYTPFNKVFDIGNATSRALNKYINNPDDFKCGSSEISSNGNGSLMRILPISLYLYYNDNNMYEVINNVSCMTHAHIYSVLSCIIYTVFIKEYLKTNNLNEAYHNMQQLIKKLLEDNNYKFISNQEELKIVFERLIYQDISKLKEEEIKSSGYVIDTLEAAFWCLLNTKNYSDSVLKAINLGEDTDTVAAITGGLSGLVYGFDNIPIKWINNLQQNKLLNEYIKEFVEISINNKKSKINNKFDMQVLNAVIYALKNDPNACKTIGGVKSPDGTFTIPESDPGKELKAFKHYLYENNFADMNYLENYEKIRNKPIEDYDYEETLTALTKIFRGDRFISLHIYGCFKDGTLLKLIEKLKSFI